MRGLWAWLAGWFLHARLLVNLCFDLVFFSHIFICCIFVFFSCDFLWPQILSDCCAAPSVKNANITEIYVIIQSACGIFCCCIFLLVFSFGFLFCVAVTKLNKICSRFYCVRLEYFTDVSQVLDGFLIVNRSISKLFAIFRVLIKLISRLRFICSNGKGILMMRMQIIERLLEKECCGVWIFEELSKHVRPVVINHLRAYIFINNIHIL